MNRPIWVILVALAAGLGWLFCCSTVELDRANHAVDKLLAMIPCDYGASGPASKDCSVAQNGQQITSYLAIEDFRNQTRLTFLTSVLVITSALGLFVSIWVGRLLDRTLQETSKIAKLTQEIGYAQSRAYLSIFYVKLAQGGAVTVGFKNSGNSPALDAKIKEVKIVVTKADASAQVKEIQHSSSHGPVHFAIDPTSSSFRMEVLQLGNQTAQINTLLMDTTVIFEMELEYQWTDVFKKPHTGKYKQAGLPTTADGELELGRKHY